MQKAEKKQNKEGGEMALMINKQNDWETEEIDRKIS